MRDLEKDLEICRQAPPGPWRWEYPAETGLRRPKARLVAANGELICDFGVESVNSVVLRPGVEPYPDTKRFIAEARQGWVEAINRAIEAEARVRTVKSELRELASRVVARSQYLDATTVELARDILRRFGQEERT